MLNRIKQLIPRQAINAYHYVLAQTAAVYYRQPSRQLIVIGVTGTNGKTTTVEMIAKVLAATGVKVGSTSTAMFQIGDQQWLNDQKMTMLGRFKLQKMLRQMVDAGCRYAVIETSSQGIDQNRHIGIAYDVAVFTNLTPEHIEYHGGFQNYKKAKLKLFTRLSQLPDKVINGKKIPKTIVVNCDDENAVDFYACQTDQHYQYGVKNTGADFRAEDVAYTAAGTNFKIQNVDFQLSLFGLFNVYNSLAAITVGQALNVDLGLAKKALENIRVMPGRMEMIDNGQPFWVIVDYAPEPASLTQAYQTIKDHQLISAGKKLIHVLGSCGGGRDVARRPILGRMAGEQADYVIVTNEDPYDDDPMEIINQVAAAAIQTGKRESDNLFKIIDRREAIKKAISLAQAGDLVLLTGKGSEQAICVADGKMLPWDERVVAREILGELGFGK